MASWPSHLLSQSLIVWQSLFSRLFVAQLQPIVQRRFKESRPGGPRRIGSRKAGWKDLVSSSYGLVLLRRKSQVFSLAKARILHKTGALAGSILNSRVLSVATAALWAKRLRGEAAFMCPY